MLNGRSGIAVDTRQRVEALLRKHGYRSAEQTGVFPHIDVVFFGVESHLDDRAPAARRDGAAAAGMVLQLAEGASLGPMRLELSTALIVRDSTAAPDIRNVAL